MNVADNHVRIQIPLCAVALLCAMATVQAEPVSGVMRNASRWADRAWSATKLWDYHRYAKDGGEATVLVGDIGGGEKLNMDVSGLTLSGLMFESLTSPFYSAKGYSITMCGDSPYVGRTPTGEFKLELPLVGDGANTLRKTGVGFIRFELPVQNFGAFEIWEGTVSPSTNRVTNPAIVAAGTPLVVRGGQVQFSSTASGGNPETTLGELRVGPGAGRVVIMNGSTVTVGALSREQCGVALVESANGASALGNTEKLLVSGRVSDAAGVVDGSLVTADVSVAPRPLDFVTYDGTDGFKCAGTGTALVSGSNVAGIADVSAATTISANTSVSALRIKDGSQLTIDSGATLTVGDGAHPAGVLFQNSASTTTAGAVNGDGTLDFGDKEGVIWFSPAASGKENARKYAFPTKISGSAGVTFASRKINNSDLIPYVTLSSGYTAGWTGPTHIAGLRMYARTQAFPGDIWIDGNAEANSAQLCPSNQTWAQHFHISGIGLSANEESNSTLYFNYQNTPTVFTGGIELLSPAVFRGNTRAVTQFKSPITGRGGLTLSTKDAGGYMSFDATNTYSGVTTFSSENKASLLVNAGGTLGAGPFGLQSGNLVFIDQKNAVITNAITGLGVLRFRDSTASLSGDVDVGTLRLGNWTNTTEIAVRSFAAGEITAERTCKISALDADSVLTVGTNGTDSAISCKIEDGAGRLSLVKRGTNTVEVLGRKSYTGSTTVLAGTLRLQNSITNSADISWWVDAADETTVAVNAEGRASKVVSKNRNGVSFGQYSSGYGLPYYGETEVNGHKALTYTCAAIVTNNTRAVGSWLIGNKMAQQRSVVMVVKPRLRDLSGNTGVFGAAWRDMGQRMTKGMWNDIWANDNGASYCTSGGFRQNGVRNDMTYRDDEAAVVVMRQGTERLMGQYSAYSEFTPALGGYATWGEQSNGYLGFNGDICEVIAFNRYISDDEAKLLENYLSLKWRGETIHDDAPAMTNLVEQSDLLPTTTDLEIYPDATFDLNGVSQTVKTLSGQGRIVNSSAVPATLTVTGEISFRGIVGSGVTLLKGDGSAADLELRVENGATVGVSDGTLAVSSYVELPITNNIAFWCDALYRPDETILRDETDGGVTNWICRMGAISNYWFNPDYKYCVTKPTYDASSYGGRGAVKFSSGKCALYPKNAATCILRTVFLVTKAGGSGLYLFGKDGVDLSFRGSVYTLNMHGQFNINPVGALLHVNGVDYTDVPVGSIAPPTNPLLLTACTETWQSDYGNYNARWILGCNMNNNGNNQEMAEIIVYTSRLTDLEIAKVEDYLMKKWGLRAGSVAAYDTAFADGASIEAEGTGTINANGAALTLSTLTGSGGSITNFSNLTVTDSITLDVVNGVVDPLTLFGDVTFGTAANGYDIPVYVDDWHDLDAAQRSQLAVSVQSADGETLPTVTGDLHEGERMQNWVLSRHGTQWNIARRGFILLVR